MRSLLLALTSLVAALAVLSPLSIATLTQRAANIQSGGSSISSTILILAPEGDAAYSTTSGFDAYGIPYQLVTVPSGGVTLPTLNSSARPLSHRLLLLRAKRIVRLPQITKLHTPRNPNRRRPQ